MRKFKNLVIGGIENKIFNLILLTGILITAAFLAVIIHQSNELTALTAETSEKQQSSITAITTDLMDKVVEGSLDRQTELASYLADQLFSDLKTRVELLGEYAEKLYSQPDSVIGAKYEDPDPAKNGQITAQMIFADGVDSSDEGLKARLGIAANMSDMMCALYGVSELTNSCFIALPEGAFLVVDNRSASKFDEAGKAISYDPRTRPWYVQATEKRGLIITDVEYDAFTGDIGVVCAMPVYVNGELTAVVGSDLFLTSMQMNIEASDENGGFVFVVNGNGHVVFSPKTEGIFSIAHSSIAQDLRQNANQTLASLVQNALTGKTNVETIQLGDGELYMVGAPMETVGWALIYVFSKEVALSPVQLLLQNYEGIQNEAIVTYRDNISLAKTMIIVLLAVLTVLLITGALILGKRIVRPLNRITKRISELDEQNLEFTMEDTFRTGDEIEVLAESFAYLSHKTVEYVGQVKRVTAEKERINSELNMAKEIQGSQLPRIFPPYPNNPSFDLFASMTPAKEVGGDFYDFFLVDDDHLAMVMADVSGKGVPAALFMMIAKTLIKNRVQSGEPISNVLSNVNNQLLEGNDAGMFVTVWLGVLTISTGEGVVVNAGHEHPAVRRAGGMFELMKYRHSLAVATLEGIRFKEHHFTLNPGDTLFVYTDGVTEATNAHNELMGEQRLLDALNREPDASPERVLTNVKTGIDEFVAGAEQFDDITMLCLKYNGPAQKDRIS